MKYIFLLKLTQKKDNILFFCPMRRSIYNGNMSYLKSFEIKEKGYKIAIILQCCFLDIKPKLSLFVENCGIFTFNQK